MLSQFFILARILSKDFMSVFEFLLDICRSIWLFCSKNPGLRLASGQLNTMSPQLDNCFNSC